MRVFLADEEGMQSFDDHDSSFHAYCSNCSIYNLLSSFMDMYPKEISFIWNEEEDSWAFRFKNDTKVAKHLEFLKLLDIGDEDYNEIIF